MKGTVRPVLAGFIASAAVLWSVAIHAPVAHAQAAHIRWDLISLTGSPPTIMAGGTASALANDSSAITLTGSGTFVAPAGGEGSSGSATGGGTWQTRDAMGLLTGSGTYEVTGLVRWDEAPGDIDGLVDTIAPGTTARAGLAILRIRYSDGERGVLIIPCFLPGAPASVFEGATATKGFVDYWNRVPPVDASGNNFTIFHTLR